MKELGPVKAHKWLGGVTGSFAETRETPQMGRGDWRCEVMGGGLSASYRGESNWG